MIIFLMSIWFSLKGNNILTDWIMEEKKSNPSWLNRSRIIFLYDQLNDCFLLYGINQKKLGFIVFLSATMWFQPHEFESETNNSLTNPLSQQRQYIHISY